MGNKKKKIDSRKRGGGFLRGIFLFFLIVIVVLLGNHFANQYVFVKEYEIIDESIPDAFDGYRIVQVTDVHSIRDTEQADMLFETIVEQRPDAVVLTGDLLDSKYYGQELADLKAGISEKMPGQDTVDFVERLIEHYYVYYVYGNHEMVLLDDVDNNPFKVAMEEIGVIFLNNSGVKITRNGESIYMLGVQDPSTLYKDSKYRECNSHTERIHAMMTNIVALRKEALYTVVLAHRPEYFEEYSTYGVDLVLTGHAHGGQVRVPFVGGVYAPGQGFFPEYTSGLFEENGTSMVVGRGIGNAVIVPRVFNPPQINTVILKKTEVE